MGAVVKPISKRERARREAACERWRYYAVLGTAKLARTNIGASRNHPLMTPAAKACAAAAIAALDELVGAMKKRKDQK